MYIIYCVKVSKVVSTLVKKKKKKKKKDPIAIANYVLLKIYFF